MASKATAAVLDRAPAQFFLLLQREGVPISEDARYGAPRVFRRLPDRAMPYVDLKQLDGLVSQAAGLPEATIRRRCAEVIPDPCREGLLTAYYADLRREFSVKAYLAEMGGLHEFVVTNREFLIEALCRAVREIDHFADLVATLRTKQSWTQVELAALFECDRGTIRAKVGTDRTPDCPLRKVDGKITADSAIKYAEKIFQRESSTV